MRIALYVALGCGLGGVARILVTNLMLRLPEPHFPVGVLTVNVLGSLTIGILAAVTAPGGNFFPSPAFRQFLMAGFCGGFTTFSFFSLETLLLLQDGRITIAAIHSTATLLISMLGVWIGYRAGTRGAILPQDTAP